MSDAPEYTATVRIQRPAKTAIDENGRSVWIAPIDDVELELMNSQELRLALAAADQNARASIGSLIDKKPSGVIVRDRATGVFDVVSEAQLQELLKNTGMAVIPDCDKVSEYSTGDTEITLSLVTTQALRVMLDADNGDKKSATEGIDNPGCDPYDNS